MSSSEDAVRDCLAEVAQRVDGDVRSDRYSRILYSTDASIYQVEPHGVLIPRSPDDVQAAVEIAGKWSVPVLARTSGTSLAGQAVNRALVIDMTRHLDRVLEIDADNRRVRVEPGVVLDDLNSRLRPFGLQFGPDPASSDRAALGGIVSNNSTGAHSILYGMTADHVQEMTVVLSDGSTAGLGPAEPGRMPELQRRGGLEGEIYRRIGALVEDEGHRDTVRSGTPRHWRRCGGYNLDRFLTDGVTFQVPQDPRFNLAKLVCGAEGSLAVMTDITLGLVPVPAETVLALIHFEDLSSALEAVPHILETDPSAVELLDHLALSLCREVPEYSRLLGRFVEGDPSCILITEFQGDGPAQANDGIERLRRLLARERLGATAVVPVTDSALQHDVWRVRKVGLGLLMSLRGDHKPIPFIEDAAVPVEHLAEYIVQLEGFCNELGSKVAYYAHASAGCLHVRPLINTKKASELAKLPEIMQFAVELLKGYGGVLSSEHGDGRSRSWMNEHFFGPDLYRLYREVKAIFDPSNLLNPGAVVNAPVMTENLRFGDSYRVEPQESRIDFEREVGFDRAVEMCNGAGACRKRTTGAMCPSFMVTREEEHSTRGRANALRAAISGRLPAAELTSPRMYEVMDLCVECKACKAECPSSVDMAKIKFEFLARYHEVHGVGLRSRLVGHAADLARIFSGPQAPLVNRLLAHRPVRWAMEKTVGFSRQSPLLPYARESFTRWFNRADLRPIEPIGRVILFNDTFNTFHEPRIAIAAAELLTTAGYEIVLPGHHCCGRPMISKGLLHEARSAARQTVDRLYPFATEGLAIVGLEPSCLLTLRDEYRYLLPGDSRVEAVAEHAVTLEEFLSREEGNGRLGRLRFGSTRRDLLLHGHCHQKALVGTGPAIEALSLPPGYTVEEVDSGCCGMAGSFGHEVEHYDISVAMAERRLLPAVREAAPETLIVASGTSCRHQILLGTGRRAMHPAEVLLEALQD